MATKQKFKLFEKSIKDKEPKSLKEGTKEAKMYDKKQMAKMVAKKK